MIICNQPTAIQTERAVVYLTGLFMYGDHQAGDASIRAFMADFDVGRAKFDLCTGSYRVRIVYPDGRERYFGDNSNTMRWYIGPKGFFPSLREAAPKQRTPDYQAISQMLTLAYGRIHGTATVLREVRRSAPDKYYEVVHDTVTEKEKGLTPVWEIPAGPDALEKQMRRFAKAVSGAEGIVCTITGGADSRLVLSHMLAAGMDPLLDITGGAEHPDVVIARQIAQLLDRELLYVSDDPEPGWIEDAIREADGMVGVCGNYRLSKKARVLEERGLLLECGGVGGEFYKNSFINLDFPFYRGKPNWKRFLQIKSMLSDPHEEYFAGETLAEIKRSAERELAYLRAYTGRTKANAYLSAYHDILNEGGSPTACMNSRHYIPYVPLYERNVLAYAYHADPYQMDGWAFHRREVSRLCPEIKGIPTDHGMTLDIDRKRVETLTLWKYWVKAGIRILTHHRQATGRIDACFAEGLSSPQYREALQRCKDLGILAPEVQELPAAIADRVFALGSIL